MRQWPLNFFYGDQTVLTSDPSSCSESCDLSEHYYCCYGRSHDHCIIRQYRFSCCCLRLFGIVRLLPPQRHDHSYHYLAADQDTSNINMANATLF